MIADNPHCCLISIHTPLAGSDMSPAISGAAFLFQSTLPLWGATSFRRFLIYVITFQSTLPLQGATGMGRRNRHRKGISIHTPLAGSDAALRKCWRSLIFQSTLPLRGATRPDNWTIWPTGYFNPHSPCGERRYQRPCKPIRSISIHTPLAGSDLSTFVYRPPFLTFQSTLPLRGATRRARSRPDAISISIHTPLAGSDAAIFCHASRSPKFQSTLPLRGATHTVVLNVAP